MKRVSVLVMVMSLTVFLSTSAFAGVDGRCGTCAQQGGAPSDPFRKFQADTIDLRQEMMNKRFEVQRENLKSVPDTAKVDALQAAITAIQAKIQNIRALSGLPADKFDGECGMKGSCGQKTGGCDKKRLGGCGKGMGGCNSAPCGAQK